MLGTDIGKRITAVTVTDQFNQFLKIKTKDEKKLGTAEERKMAKRAEMRKRGIMVKADDQEETPTIFEKGDGPFQPYVITLPEKPIKWITKKKNTKTKGEQGKKQKKTKNTRTKPIKMPKKKESQASVSVPKASNIPLKKSSSSKVDVSTKDIQRASSKESMKVIKGKTETDVNTSAKEKRKSSAEEVITPAEAALEQKAFGNSKPDETTPQLVNEQASAPENKKSQDSETSAKKALDDSLPVALDRATSLESINSDSAVNLKSDVHSTTSTDSIPPLAVPAIEKQTGAFEILDDDEFEKTASVINDVDEKEILKLAHKLLKVAKKHKALEKCLTPEENEMLAKFFSGKVPLTPKVLSVLDTVLDKIIDYLQKSQRELDEETKKLLKRRNHLKAAMMKEFLVSPQYLPKPWTRKFNEWKTEADKKKYGINWFKILFEYPKHKGFEDGPEDIFGNFKRRDRGLFLGLIIGPNDVKSFEETKREADCQGMFLDTKLIERAESEPSQHSSTFEDSLGVKSSLTRSDTPLKMKC